jgi:hypothetical protein
VVHVLVGARGLESAGPARHAFPIDVRLLAHVADTLHLPSVPVRRLARRARHAHQRARVVCGHVLWA